MEASSPAGTGRRPRRCSWPRRTARWSASAESRSRRAGTHADLFGPLVAPDSRGQKLGTASSRRRSSGAGSTGPSASSARSARATSRGRMMLERAGLPGRSARAQATVPSRRPTTGRCSEDPEGVDVRLGTPRRSRRRRSTSTASASRRRVPRSVWRDGLEPGTVYLAEARGSGRRRRRTSTRATAGSTTWASPRASASTASARYLLSRALDDYWARPPRRDARPLGQRATTSPPSASTAGRASRRWLVAPDLRAPALELVLFGRDGLADALAATSRCADPARRGRRARPRRSPRARSGDGSGTISELHRGAWPTKDVRLHPPIGTGMRRIVVILLAIACGSRGRADGRCRVLGRPQIRVVVASGLMGPSVAEFRPTTPLTRGDLGLIVAGLTGNAEQVARRARRRTSPCASSTARSSRCSASRPRAAASRTELRPRGPRPRRAAPARSPSRGSSSCAPTTRAAGPSSCARTTPATRAEAAFSVARVLDSTSGTRRGEPSSRALRPSRVHRLAAARAPARV